MIVASMTGFARAAGNAAGARWTWDIKSVNGKGLDLRLKLPAGCEPYEAEWRQRLVRDLHRGTVHLSLVLHRDETAPALRIDRAALALLARAAAEAAAEAGLPPPAIDGLFAVRGIVEIGETDATPDLAPLAEPLTQSLETALAGLVKTRREEGAALAALLRERLAAVSALSAAADDAPGRRPEAVRQRLAERVAELAGAVPALDPARLHQEALLLAAKADVREELDRLTLHAASALALLDQGGPVGRRLDFLAQELAREASTLCAKSNDAGLTLIGLELRGQIDQMREQVQNLE